MFRKFTPTIVKSSGLMKDTRILTVRHQTTDYSVQCKGLTIEPKNQVLWISFDRPNKLNAITREMYVHLTDTFRKVNADSSIKALIWSGNGDYYSSGNDLTNFAAAMQYEGGPKAGLTKSSEILYDFIESLIRLEKFLIAAVNGPAVGIAVSTLPLCDLVVASDKATFQTPFTSLGQCPEACSSITFPQTLGRSRASELLLLNMTWDAKKAHRNGFVSDVVEHDKLRPYLDTLAKNLVKSCYPKSLITSKKLILNEELKRRLLEANKLECKVLLDCWLGEECNDAVQKFFKRSAKSS